MPIHVVNLSALDLNLLIVLDALLAERSVTRAARRLGLTQPATSNALDRLRRALADPLLVRTTHGMTPTPRALALAGPVRTALVDLLHGVCGSARFDPATATRTFTIAASDYGETLLLPGIVRRILQSAPNVAVRLVPLDAEFSASHFDLGAIDLAIGYFSSSLDAERQDLLEDRFVCVSRADSPRVGNALGLEELVKLDGITVAPRGERAGLLDLLLAEHGLARRVVLRVPNFLSALVTVAETELVAILPERLGRAFAPPLPLRFTPLQVELPVIRLSQVWHARDDPDPAHAWLRALVLETAIQRVNAQHHDGA
jgi:DNA-binding transcriptional LysR family regulator